MACVILADAQDAILDTTRPRTLFVGRVTSPAINGY